jgi:phosphoglucosamine mutase
MTRKYFGTDGIRGQVGSDPMTAEFALRLASAAARVLAPDGGTVVIGKDTRVSGYMFESALEAGFVAAGMDVLMLGPLPTPGIAHITRKFGADLGVVISASHNAYADNGIKFFDCEGGKLSDDVERAIESHLEEPAITRESRSLGRARRVDDAAGRYQDFCLASVPQALRLDGMKIVVDCSHGAAYRVAPAVFSELGAEIVPIGCSPNGRNINDGCGSTAPQLMQLTVKGVGADLGVAVDGDGDRLIMCDTDGSLIDGDQLLYVISTAMKRSGQLEGPVVGTLMSNLGLEKALAELEIDFRRANVGDRYVLEMLRDTGGQIGGETSGHLICLDKATTGDAIVAALQVLSIMRDTGQSLADLVSGMPRYPQLLINVRTESPVDLEGSADVCAAVKTVEAALGDRGRVVLRRSGTEPVVRVMVEGEDAGQVESGATEIADAVRIAGA